MAKGTNLALNSVLPFSDFIQPVVLAAGVGQAFDVPAGMGFVAFSMDQDFWTKYGSTSAIVPAASTTAASTAGELNPTIRNLGSTASCTGISLISASDSKGSLAWYARA